MLKILKTFSAITLLLCLFLPLSQCTQEANPGQSDSELKTIVYTPIQQGLNDDLTFKAIVPSLLFVLPFVLLLIQMLRSDLSIKLNKAVAGYSWFLFLIEFFSVLALAVLLLFHSYMATPLYGWYISCVAACIYLISVLTNIVYRR